MVIAAIVGIAVWFAVGALSGTEVTPSAPPAGRSTGSSVARSSPSPTPDETPRAKKSSPPTTVDEGQDDGLVTADVSVQVLNGTGGVAKAAESMAARLRERGYEIAAVGDALTIDRTVVYWSESEDERAARALARRFGWAAGPAPPNLSDAVDVHVIVGPDESPP